MWVTIETTSKYILRGRTVSAAGKILGCMLVATATGGELLFAQFIVDVRAEDIGEGW